LFSYRSEIIDMHVGFPTLSSRMLAYLQKLEKLKKQPTTPLRIKPSTHGYVAARVQMEPWILQLKVESVAIHD